MPTAVVLIVIGAGPTTVGFLDFGDVRYSPHPLVRQREYIDAVFKIFSGVVILDSPTNPIKFLALDEMATKKLGLLKEDVITYNSEIEEVQAIAETITKKIVIQYGDQKNINLKLVEVEAQVQWETSCLSGELSNATCRVLKTIRTQKIQ